MTTIPGLGPISEGPERPIAEMSTRSIRQDIRRNDFGPRTSPACAARIAALKAELERRGEVTS